jgi:hypothetical protein
MRWKIGHRGGWKISHRDGWKISHRDGWKISHRDGWKFGHRGHDSRQIDLMAALALVIVIVAACRFFSGGSVAPSTAAFVVPSQSVRW